MHINSKCHFCERCEGKGCVAELPGMGGVYNSANFQANCAAWAHYPAPEGPLPKVRIGPMTGAQQNMGFEVEGDFYPAMLRAAREAGIGLSIGDGTPDEKLRDGIAALKGLGAKGVVIIKPYSNERVRERMAWAESDGVAEILGIDIDSYRIKTMQGLVELFKKSAADLIEIRRGLRLPFLVKGIFRPEDVELVREVKPDIIVISNHGGRVETEHGSTADYLAAHGRELANYSGEVWVDGGLRSKRDLLAAAALGAKGVFIGRPLVSALMRGELADGEAGGLAEVKRVASMVYGLGGE